MDVRCERCQTEYEVEDSRLSELGTEVQCSDCGHHFVIKRQAPSSKESSQEWAVETSDGQIHRLRDLAMLQRWIIERRVVPSDRVSQDGKTWQRLGDIADLTAFFDLVESAERANLEAAKSVLPAPAAASLQEAKPPAKARKPTPVNLPQGPVPLAPPVLLPPEPASKTVGHDFLAGAPPLKPSKEPQRPLGAFPQSADVGETEMIRFEPAKSYGLLKVVFMLAIAAAVAYAGISLHGYATRPQAISPEGADQTSPPKGPSQDDTVTPKAASATIESPREAGAGSEGATHAPVVEPISDERDDEGAKSAKPQAVAAQGYLALNRKQYQQAITLFKRAIASNPNNGTAIFGLAEAYRSNGQKVHALLIYRRYLNTMPNGPDAKAANQQVRLLEGKKHATDH
jgi:predicted Zn finger-like uncharacterized protein